ncbi:hypothetical protein AKO1_014590 [Acrasis kona]|uniref:Zn(2)-C6 fungal-type domain-containing protein n=1 Tax=Acrasis kona TaxID=1008807 RepID=A0AAW2Z348_9EUKA
MEQQTQLYSYQSCDSCRRQHKKCDKVLSGCSLCISKNKKCVYGDVVSKRGPKTKATKKLLDDISDDMLGQKDVSAKSESYTNAYSEICYVMPIIKKESTVRILNRIQNNTKIDEEDPSFKQEEVAFVYAILSVVVMCNNPQVSKEHFEKARTIISPHLDELLDNFAVASCCIYLGIWSSFQNQINRSKFYLGNVHNFINYQKSVNAGDYRLHFIQNEYATMVDILEQGMDMQRLFDDFVYRHYALQDFYTKNPSANGYEQPPPFYDSFLSVQDVESLSNANVESSESLQRTSKAIYHFYERLSPYFCSDQINERRTVTMLITHGAELQRYQKMDRGDLARRHADRISTIITTSNLIDFRVTGVLLKAAASVHLLEMENCVDDNDRRDLLQQLNNDYNSICRLSELSGLWKTRLEDVRVKLENVIWMQTNNNNITSNQMYKTTLEGNLTGSMLFQDEDNFLTKDDIEAYINSFHQESLF